MTIQQLVLYSAAATGLLVFLSVMVLALTWLERKALARIQMRMGPMRVGFHGALQPIADALKLVTKEDILPSWADRRVYWLAPIAVFVPALMLWVTILSRATWCCATWIWGCSTSWRFRSCRSWAW